MQLEERFITLEKQVRSLKMLSLALCGLMVGVLLLAATGSRNDTTSKVQIVGAVEVTIAKPVKVINNSSSSSGRTFKIQEE